MKMLIGVLSALLVILPAASAVKAAAVEYDLEIAEREVVINGRSAEGMTINGNIPGPTLYFREGDLARIRVHNAMKVATSIHWHGLLVPPAMDGVPFITQPPIAPGATFTYEFPLRQSGTYWYHSHSGLQEQRGLYGAIVIAPVEEKVAADRDRVVLLSDWTTDSPEYVLKTLKRGSEWYALEKGSAQSILGAATAGRLGDYYRRELQRMPPMDLADVAYDYFLANGKTEEIIAAKPGERLRLRIINGSATTYFHLEFSGGPLTIISADGQAVEPVAGNRFLLAVAETYDLLLTLPGPGAYELRATAHDGSAWTSVWIGAGERHQAATIPRPDVYQAMHHLPHAALFALTPAGSMGMPDRQVNEGRFDRPGMTEMPGMEHNGGEHMPGHGNMPGMGGDVRSPELSGHEGMAGHQATGHVMEMPEPAETGHQHPTDNLDELEAVALPQAGIGRPPGGREYGARFGLLAADAASRGELAPEGGEARPLTPYAILRSPIATTLPAGKEIREIRLTLDGDMQRYVWMLNNRVLSETDHLLVREGEVVRLIMINRTMMHHPMHLHGHFFRVLNGQGDHAPRKHTVDVAPMSTTVIEFYTDEPGDWFFHCHLLYHMKSGMERLVHYQDFQPDPEVLRPRLYDEHWYSQAEGEVLSNMSEGMVSLAKTRIMLKATWEIGWEEVDAEEWEGIATAGWYRNRFTTFFLGGRSEGVRSQESATVGILGLSYLLPLNVNATAWLDSEGDSRIRLDKEFELAPRLALHAETQYDSREKWEGAASLTYLLTRHLGLAGKWHSDYGFGAGLHGGF